MQRSQFAVILLVAIAVMLVAAGNGAANRISTSNEQYRIVYSPMRFRTRGGTSITCNTTLEGSLINAGVLNKISGGQYGFITAVTKGICNIGFLTETLSWPIIYTTFIGQLPDIASTRTYIDRFRFVWGTLFRCLYESNATFRQPLNWFRESGGQISSVELAPAWLPSTTPAAKK